MRSAILSLTVGLGVLGFSLATPTQVKAEDHRGPAYTSNGYTSVAWGRRGWGYGRSYYPGYGRGYGRGYGYPYGGYGGYRRYYSPRYYGGYGYPYGGYGYGVRPYGGYYGSYGFFW